MDGRAGANGWGPPRLKLKDITVISVISVIILTDISVISVISEISVNKLTGISVI